MNEETQTPDLVVYLHAATLGRGDEDLGRVLMGSYLDTLSHFQGRVTHVLLVNGAAHLAAQGSPVLAQLQQLEELGAAVRVCGTCVKHFGLQDRLAVGSVSNMVAIQETLVAARRILQP